MSGLLCWYSPPPTLSVQNQKTALSRIFCVSESQILGVPPGVKASQLSFLYLLLLGSEMHSCSIRFVVSRSQSRQVWSIVGMTTSGSQNAGLIGFDSILELRGCRPTSSMWTDGIAPNGFQPPFNDDWAHDLNFRVWACSSVALSPRSECRVYVFANPFSDHVRTVALGRVVYFHKGVFPISYSGSSRSQSIRCLEFTPHESLDITKTESVVGYNAYFLRPATCCSHRDVTT